MFHWLTSYISCLIGQYVDNERVLIDGPIGMSTDTPLPTSIDIDSAESPSNRLVDRRFAGDRPAANNGGGLPANHRQRRRRGGDAAAASRQRTDGGRLRWLRRTSGGDGGAW
ncbi:hypothetical protein F2Q70_00030861 [Brassica cretica]|uniref:Uncharacterized protein n=1 Tax=Brassica cretica TaxID=69181 RepID=A0A8S9FD95_BRACR|nr:hypothetical protein F2Q70_00030861 [Brassica cretica]